MTTGPATDVHSHLIPGVDDGAANLAEARAAVAAFDRDGVTAAIATPHFDGSLTLSSERVGERLALFDAGFAALTSDADVLASGVRLMRGVELMLDVPNPDVCDDRLRLNGTHFVLVEFPALQLPPSNADYAMRALREHGWQPVLAHPERYRNVDDTIEQLLPLRYAGAHFQINAGSLLGHYGTRPQRHALALLERGWVEYGSSDFHARGMPAVAAARAQLAAAGATEHAELLFCENTARLVRDELPRPVPPLALNARKPRPWWARLFGSR